MNLSVLGIRNPTLVAVLFAALFVAGLLGLSRLTVQNFPDIDVPTLVVTVAYPGADPNQVEAAVTRPLENELANVSGVRHVSSSVESGLSRTTVEFRAETVLDRAASDVRDAVVRARPLLPPRALEPAVTRIETTGKPVVTYAVGSSELGPLELSWLLDGEVLRELRALPGVGSVRRIGGLEREVRVVLDADSMDAMGLTAAEVSRQIRRTQAEQPGGALNLAGRQQLVRADARVDSAVELAALSIPLPGGRSTRLDAIASVRDGAADATQMALLDGRPALAFEVVRARGAGEIDVAQAVAARVREATARHPHLSFSEISNTADLAREGFEDSINVLLLGAVLAVVVVWLFLRDWRAMLLAAVALPLSIVPTFGAMYWFGSSLNTLTMLALALVTGILVDDAIVEVENIVRHLRMGKRPLQAAIDAATEIGLAVLTTTFALCAVFLPVAFMPGIAGRFFVHFSFTATAAILFSLLVARLLTPLMAVWLLRAHAENSPSIAVQRYQGLVRAAVRHRWITLMFALVYVGGSLALAGRLGAGFLPTSDGTVSRITLDLLPGATLADSEATVEHARAMLAPLPEVRRIFAVAGSGVSGGERSSYLDVVLTEPGERRPQSLVEQDALARLAALPGVRAGIASDTAGNKLKVTLVGDDLDQLATVASRVTIEMAQLPGLAGVFTPAQQRAPQIEVLPIGERAAEFGVDVDTIADTLQVATRGDTDRMLPRLTVGEREIPIRTRFPDAVRSDVERLRALRIPTSRGSVPLEAVARVEMSSGPSVIERRDRRRSVTIEANISTASVQLLQQQVRKLPALQSLPAGVTLLEDSDAEMTRELFVGFATAMGLGLLSVYAVLVLLFKRFLQPLTVVGSLPLSLGGAFGALYVFGYTLSMPALIGLLTLMGIVTKNGIMLVEYAMIARHERGLDAIEAIVEACGKRAQPILMTTTAMVAGMVPIAAGLTADPSFRAPMALAVIGGLVTSTLLSLVVVPALYVVIEGLGQRLTRLRWGGRVAAGA